MEFVKYLIKDDTEIDISTLCDNLFPCVHIVKINNTNEQEMTGIKIRDIFLKNKKSIPEHFKQYNSLFTVNIRSESQGSGE
jgi:hypothetical protein